VNPVRTAFLGTPEAAIPSLEALTRVSDVQIVITRPNRPRGRSRRIQSPPVHDAARTLGLEIEQPRSASELVAALEGRRLDLGVVVAFGMLLDPEILALPENGFLNVHFSLLPRWRGAAPVERAIMAGDDETGVTIMQMDEGLDTGPIVAARQTPIGPEETGGALRGRLADLGAELLAETVDPWVSGQMTARPQPTEGITYATRLETADRHLDFSMDSIDASNRVRALAPAPGARLDIEGVPHKVLEVSAAEMPLTPGEWNVDHSGFPVAGFTDGALTIVTIQPPGKRAMSGAEWLRGRPLPQGGAGESGVTR
jgi:methionyl-tRNA formyltransferase